MPSTLLVFHYWCGGAADSSRQRKIAYWLLVVLVACLGLMKFTFLMAGLIVIGVVALDQIMRLRMGPTSALLYVATWIAGWLLSGQALAGVATHMRMSLTLSQGYSGLSLVGGPRSQLFAALAGLLLLWWTASWCAYRNHRGWAYLFSIGIGLQCFLVYKTGFVRQDASHTPITAVVVSTTLLLTAGLFTARRWRTPVRTGLLIAASVPPVVIAGHWRPYIEPFTVARSWEYIRGNLNALATGLGRHEEDYENALRQIREKHPLPDLPGTVDVISSKQAAVLAHGFDYRQRPLYHGYMVTHPVLNRANAAFFESERAPDHVLFTTERLNDFFWSQMDSLTWRELLERYEVEGDSGGFLILRKRRNRWPTRLEPLRETTATLGKWVDVPDSDQGAVWVRMMIHPKPAAHLLNLLFRPQELQLEIRAEDGTLESHRLVRGIAEAGFLLSPVVKERAAFGRMVKSDLVFVAPEDRVKSFRVVSGRRQAFGYEPEFKLSLFRLAREPRAADPPKD